MRNARSDQLIRDIAALIAKYKPSDWLPVISELQKGSDVQARIATALEDLLNKSNVSRSKKPRKKAVVHKKFDFPAINIERKQILEPLRSALLNRRFLSSAKSLREACYHLGMKTVIPSNRSDAVQSLISFLDQLDEASFGPSVLKVIDFMPSDNLEFEKEYRRWFNMILSPVEQNQSNSER